jgi:phosphoglycerate dehydrogenase-like enzyme
VPERLRSSGARLLVVRGTKVTAAALDAGPLALVVRAVAGINTIDVAAASARGIYVSNCPGGTPSPLRNSRWGSSWRSTGGFRTTRPT